MLHNLDTIYYKPDLVRISQPKLISVRTFFGLQRLSLFDQGEKLSIANHTKTLVLKKSSQPSYTSPTAALFDGNY